MVWVVLYVWRINFVVKKKNKSADIFGLHNFSSNAQFKIANYKSYWNTNVKQGNRYEKSEKM